MIEEPVLLLVEDNEADVELIAEILYAGEPALMLSVVKDGVAAVEALGDMAAAGGGSLPDLVLLDLNLPRKDGRQVLAEIRSDMRMRHVPVVVLTSSDTEDDVLRSYQLGANSYVIKPGELHEYRSTVEAIRNYWLGVAALPHGRGQSGVGGNA
ncbi:MAG TPA: response regulator [Dehalococcoidia bacterium]|nr:response regulator [Dehalococcoidia bacterium]